MHSKLNLSVITLCCVLSVNAVNAKDDDFKKPITVDSKSHFVDGKRKTSIFREDVHVQQGSLAIDADEVEVNASKGEGKEVFIARGKPAVYTQDMEDGSTIKAVASEIRYQVSTRTLKLSGEAELHQNSSMVKGESITFNLDKQQLLAEGQDGENGRVTTVFNPESQPEETGDKQ
ncbi:lipopolysaccharide transport periplasmic protein LptA [Alteromonas sp. a30]|uniref:lipopolysaccharide transport periplasmic protein LptA n=1 Tax=Alteromonas sp. a30 TaxID=2730917 RepID=UPI002281FB97|nr:lipopolysaccharide transport periplasmic protein LptA [Alteromonas sp. a30]MCY7294823.1 lipopolysaccharide transport periplasmic protein LptA [Alteromonas sp. a30]